MHYIKHALIITMIHSLFHLIIQILFDYLPSYIIIQDDDLDDITYESIFDFPRELLQRKIVITRKEPLINIPSTIVWYGTWFDEDIDFSSESIEPEDMLST